MDNGSTGAIRELDLIAQTLKKEVRTMNPDMVMQELESIKLRGSSVLNGNM